MPTYKLTLEYVGTAYAGWQVQPSKRTVQGELLALMRRIFDEPGLLLAGAARTDAGVHARGQVASFTSTGEWEPRRLRRALNGNLPGDIAVVEVEIAGDAFHARRSAVGRIYRYQIATGEVLSPFLAPFAHHYRSDLDVAAMSRGASHLLGEHDFSAFRAAGDVSSTPVKTIRRSDLEQEGSLIVYTVEGTSFLQHMVRTIAGSLLDVGRGHRPPEWIAEALRSRDRARSGATLPAKGLSLQKVLYPPGP
jgi:tRNA pseudouridine38-40 synthase